MRSVRIACGLLVALSGLAFLSPLEQTHAQGSAYQEDFEDGQAQGWELAPGWEVTLDGPNHVLAGEGHVWARSNQSSQGDHRVSFRLKLLAGRIHLVVRLTDESRYFLGFTEERSDLSKQYFPDEFHENLTAANVPRTLGRWYQVEIVTRGSTIELWIDGTRQWAYTDPQPLTNGSFALETQEGARAYVDDIVIQQGSAPVSTSAPPRPSATVPAAAPRPTAGPPPAAPASLNWVRTGGPLGGLGYDVRMRPDDADVMLVTDAWAGVFISTDGGANWHPSSTGITVRTGGTGDAVPVFCLTIDPTTPNILWAGTQSTRGIFKSTDGGSSWRETDSGVVEQQGITFRGFAVDPTDSDIVYAAGEVSSWTWSSDRQPHNGREFDMTQGVVYKTVNGGQSWRAVWRGDNLARYIWIDPRDTDVLYVSTGIFDREAANSVPTAKTPGGEGVVKSTDGGATWTSINNGLHNLYVGSLFMDPQDPDRLIAATGNNQYRDGAGAYLTVDGGLSWTLTLDPALNEPVEAVEFATSDPRIAYAASADAVYRSQDGGQTWRQVTGDADSGWGPPGVRAGFPIDLQVDPRDPDRLFANAYGGGNFLSEDGGRTWTDASRGYTGAQVRGIAVDPTQPGRVIAAARSGLFISLDGGEDWKGLSNPPVAVMEWNAIAIDPGDPQHLVSETNWGNFLVNSRNSGATWRQAFNLSDQNFGFAAIAFAPSSPTTIYAGSTGYFSAGSFDPAQPGKGIYVTLNGGQSWSSANDSLSRDASVYGLAIDPGDARVVFAASSNQGLLRTSNGGQSWQRVQGGLPADSALSVAVSPAGSGLVLVGLQNRALYRSTDGGVSWRRSAQGMNPEARITSVVFDPSSSGEVVYAADLFSGVYRSTDGGRSWSVINSGLVTRSVNALAVSADGLHLYAASEGGGVFRLDLNGQPPQAAPIPSALSGTPTPGPSPTRAAPTAILMRTASPATPPASPAVPTSAPSGKLGFCGGAAAVPVALVGWVWSRSSRRRPAR
jgi:photosystem II stability/assembly factor-like uncharacterized protein